MTEALGVRAASGWWQAAPNTSAIQPASGERERFAFRALLVFLFLLFLAPQNLMPGLASLRPALVAGGLAVGSCAGGRFLRHERVSRPSRALGLAAALGGWAILTIPLSYWPGGSVAVLLDLYLKALALFWLLAHVVDTPERLRSVMVALTVLGLPLAITGLRNYSSGAFLDTGAAEVPRIAGYQSGLAGNPNDLALVLSLLVPLAIGIAQSRDAARSRAFAFLAAALLAAGVVVTFSRAGFMALTTTAVLFGGKCLRRGRVAPVAGVLLLVLLALPLLPEGYVSRLTSIADLESDPTGSAQARRADALAALRVVAAHPILGTGLGTGILALNEERGARWTAIHNVYLQQAVELGLPGLALFLALLVSSYRSLRKVRAEALLSGQRDKGALAEGIEVALVTFAVAGFFYPVAYHFYFYLVAGLAVAAAAPGAGEREKS